MPRRTTYPECVVCCVNCYSHRSLHGHGHLEVSLVSLPHHLEVGHAGPNLVLVEATPLGHALVGVAGLGIQPTGVNDVLKCCIHLTTLTTMVAIETYSKLNYDNITLSILTAMGNVYSGQNY